MRELVLLAAMVLLVVSALSQHLGQRGATDAVAPGAESTPSLSGPARVTDGDTIRLEGVRIRLQGIDAPEIATAEGRAARRHLAGVIGAGDVTCTDTGERSYDRVVAVCRTEAGEDLAERMVADGWAVDLPRFSGGRYEPAEQQAREMGRGMHGFAQR